MSLLAHTELSQDHRVLLLFGLVHTSTVSSFDSSIRYYTVSLHPSGASRVV